MSAIGFAPLPAPLRSRRTLLSSCAVASALVVLGHPLPAAADGYNATIQTAGTVGYTPTPGNNGLNQGTISLTSSSTILTWTPTDVRTTVGTSIDFQSTGATTNFVGPGGIRDANFSVLNKINPVIASATGTARSITFNGTTNALGSVLFYSPGGIIISPTARFDVGSLLLSTNNITGFSEDGYGSQSIDFASGTAGSLAMIEVQQGNAPDRGLFASGTGANYVALVAPRIIQNGTVSASQTAYIAAEAGNLTTDVNVNSGLFSFAITTGTSAADALTHGGVTALTGNEGTLSRAFMVAVPKNTAITMLVGGSVTYADAASVEDGAVILSTGGVTVTGDAVRPTAFNANPDVGAANIVITGTGAGSFGSIYAAARSSVSTTGSFAIHGNADLFGVTGASFGADGNTGIGIRKIGEGLGGNLNLTSYAQTAGGGRTGGTTTLFGTNGGFVSIEGDAVLDSSGLAQTLDGVTAAANGTGGTSTVTVTGTQLTVGGGLTVRADGAGANGGTGRGGSATMGLINGSLSVGRGLGGVGSGDLIVSAGGTGGIGAVAGAGSGNIASITATGRVPTLDYAVRVGGTTTVSANGTGGAVNAASSTGGAGTGGTASITLNPVTTSTQALRGATFASDGAVTITAAGAGTSNSNGSFISSGGAGTGGTASLSVNGSSLIAGVSSGSTTAYQALTVTAAGTGGNGNSTFSSTPPAAGGAGSGGSATVSNSFGNIGVSSIGVSAAGVGGAGGSSPVSGSGYGLIAGATGGGAVGGRAVLTTNLALDVPGGIAVDASARGGAGGGSGTSIGGTGGSATAGGSGRNFGTLADPLPGGAFVTITGGGETTTSGLAVRADGVGGVSGNGLTLGLAGDGSGGNAALTVQGTSGRAALTSDQGAIVSAQGYGGSSGYGFLDRGGVGVGGGADGTAGSGARAVFDNADISLDALSINSGGTGVAGGTGGATALTISNGATLSTLAQTQNVALTLTANGVGSGRLTGANAGTGAAGTGGSVAITLDAVGDSETPFVVGQALTATADGTGYGPTNVGVLTGGIGTGGAVNVLVSNGSVVDFTNGVILYARGTGGRGFNGDGGAGQGGTIGFTVSDATATATALQLLATGTGGTTGSNTGTARTGGAGTGGAAGITLSSAGTGALPALTIDDLTSIDVGGTGGSAGYGGGTFGSAGGTGTGGGFASGAGAYIDVQTGTATLATVALSAGGTGGGSSSGGAGGTGRGGKASVSIGTAEGLAGTLTLDSLVVGADGQGGDHSSGYGSPGGAGGAGIGGSAALKLNGGALTNTGLTMVSAFGSGTNGSSQGNFTGQAAGAGGAATGGSATVDVTGGTLTSGGLQVSAGASAGFGGNGDRLTSGAGGTATAGGAVDAGGERLTSSTGAALTVNGANSAIVLTGNLRVSANAQGGDGGSGFDEESGGAGGAARGGSASITVTNGGTIGVSDDAEGTVTASLSASGYGGYGGGGNYSGNTSAPIGGAGGDASGGTLSLTSSGGSSVRIGNLAFDGSASGGYGAPEVAGGNAIGGSATILADGGQIEATDPAVNAESASVNLDLHAFGGSGGGSARGGSATITASGQGSFDDDMRVDTSATGRDGVGGHYGAAGGAGGNATAGDFTLDLGGGSIDGLTIVANATGGSGGNAIEAGYGGAGGAGGSADGGTISLTARNGASIDIATISATRVGGVGGNATSNTTDGAPGANGTDGVRGSPQGINGTDGQRGGAGAAGGRGGDGGAATGTSLSLFASQGTITLSGVEGSSTIDVSATAGNGGAGGNGSNGGAGGAGGAGAPASTDTLGNPLPAGAPGNAGPQGFAGAGGDAGNGGGATGGSVLLSADGGTLALGDLTIRTVANGSSTSLPGNAGSGDPTGIGGSGFNAIAGQAVGGDVSLVTSDVDVGDGGTAFGLITGGALTIDASGSGGLGTSSYQLGFAGRISLHASGRFLSDDTNPTGSIALDSLNATAANHSVFGDFRAFPGGDADFSRVDVFADGGRISIGGDATLAATDDITLRVENGGQFRVGRLLDVSAGLISTSQNGGSVETPNLIAANSVSFFAGSSIISAAPIVATRNEDAPGTINFTSLGYLQADDLTATDSIAITAGNSGDHNNATAVLGNLRTTALVDPNATDLDEAGGGTISIVVGEQFLQALVPNTDLTDSNLEITGTIQASNRVTATAGGDVAVRAGGQVLSDNLVRLDAGDNVAIDSGAIVRAALNPLADPVEGTGDQDLDSPAGLFITSGVQTVAAPGLVPGEVPAIIIGGTVTSGVVTDGVLTSDPAQRRGILLHGSAIQAEGSTIGGRSLSVEIAGAPATTDFNDDFGTLTGGCYGGDACLGTLDLTNLLTIGGLTGTDVLPTNVRIQNGSNTVRTMIRAQDSITLGTDGGTATFGGSDLLRVQALGGAVNLLGETTLQGASAAGGITQILGETGIEGGNATIRSTDTVGLYTGSGGLNLRGLEAATIDGLNADLSTATPGSLTVAGAINFNGLLSVTSADIDLTAGGDISITQAEVADGRGIALRSTGGSVYLNSAGESGFGTPTDITIASSTGAATLNNAAALRDITVSAAGEASASNITAGDDISISGATATLGAMTTDGSFAESGYGADGSNISITAAGNITTTGTISAFDTLSISNTTGLISADTLSAGNDVIVNGNALSIASVTSRGTSLENGYGVAADGSNISLTATGAGDPSLPSIFVDSANAFQDLSLLASDAAGTISANSLTAGRDIAVQSGASIDNIAGTAGRDYSLTSTSGSVTGSDISAVRDLTLSAATFIDLTDGGAGRDLRLSAGTNAGSTGTLTAGDDIFIDGATVSIGSATTTGAFLETGYGSDGSNITVTAPGAIGVSGTANAFDTLTITSSGAQVTANTLSAGDDAIVSGAGLSITSVTSRGTSLENGYGATPDGSNVRLTASGPDAPTLPAIFVATADAFQDFTANATNAAGSIAGGTLRAGRDLRLTAGASASGTALTAGDDIFVNAATVSIANATSTGAFAESGYGADGSNITIAASGAISVTGAVNAFDTLRLTSTGGAITANQPASRLTAGNDVIASGTALALTSVVSRGTSTEPGGPVDGSNIALTATGADTGGVAALQVTGADAANDLTVTATNAGGSIAGGTARAGRDILVSAPGAAALAGGNAGRDLTLASTNNAATGGTLVAGRDLILRAGTAASLTAGTAGDDILVTGATALIGSATTTGSFAESGYGADGSNISVTTTGALGVTGTANAFGDLTLTSSGGRIAANILTAGDDVVARGTTLNIASATSRGAATESGYGATPDGSNIVLTAIGPAATTVPAIVVGSANAARDLTLDATSSAFVADTSPATGSISATTLAAGRDIVARARLAISSGNDTAGRDVILTSSTANVAGGAVVATRDISVNAGTFAALASGNAGRDLNLTAGSGSLASGGSFTAGDDIRIGGGSVSVGSLTTTGTGADTEADGSNIAISVPGNILITGTADAFGDLALTSSGGRISALALTAGDDAIVSGAGLSITSVTSRGATTESGYGAVADGSNIVLTATGAGSPTLPALVVLNADAFQDLTAQATNAAGALSGGTLRAGRDATLSAGAGATVTSATAGRDIRLSAGTLANAATLAAGDDIFVDGATVTIGSATTSGTFAETGYGADGSNITVNASGAIAVSGTANAFDDLTITSSGGPITANVLTAGDDAVVNGNRLSITSVTSRGTSTESGYGATPDGSNILLTATGADGTAAPAILVTSANAARDLTLQAASANGSIGATLLAAGRDIAATAGGGIGVTSGTSGRDLSLTSTNNVVGATSLTAGRNLAVAALGTVTLGDAIANGPVVLAASPSDPIPASGLVTISAGRSGTTGSYGAADIVLNGTVRAAGHVLATAGRDIVVGPTAQVRSDNRVTLNAGDDILIRSGAVVSAALAPAPVTVVTSPTGGTTIVSPAALVLNAGSLALGYTPAAGNVAALIVDGSLNAASRPVSLTAGAIQADSSALSAGSLSVNVGNAPAAGAAQSNDGGQLRLGCLQGDVCLGAVTLTGFTAGTTLVPGALSIGEGSRPTNVRVAGAVDVASIAILAQDSIFLGDAAATAPIAQTAGGRVTLDAAAGSVNLLGALTLTGGAATGTTFSGRTVSLDAGTDVNGAAASIVSRGPLAINAGGSVTLASTQSAEATQIDAAAGDIRIGSLTTTTIENSGDGPGSGVILTAGGDVSGLGGAAANVDAVGDVYVRAGGDVVLGTAIARNGASASDLDGSDIDIVAGGAVSLASGTASDDAFLTAGTTLTIGTLAANGETANDSSADTQGGYIRLAGGTIGADALSATTSIDAEATDLLRVDDARSPGTISFSAGGADLPPATGTPDGVLAVELGTVDAGTQLSIAAPNGGIRFASVAAPRILLDAATRIAGGDATARAGDFTAGAAGDIVLGTVTASDNITATAGGAFSATSLSSAVGNPTTGLRNITVDAGTTIDIGAARADRGTVSLTAGGAIDLGTGSAGGSVLLTSQDRVTTGALVAGTVPDGDDGDAGGIAVDAATNATVASANAPGDVSVIARAGDIAIGDVTTGANALLFAANNASVGAVQAAQRFYVAHPATLEFVGDSSDYSGLDDATPYALNGAATLTGPVTAGSATVAAAQGIAFGTITTTGTARLGALDGAVTGNAILAGGDVLLNSLSTITLASADAGGRFAADGYGAQTYGTITSAGDVLIHSLDAVTASRIQAGDDIEIGANSAAIDLAITTGSGVDTLDNGALPAFPNTAPAATDPTPPVEEQSPPVELESTAGDQAPLLRLARVVQPTLEMPDEVGEIGGSNIRVTTTGDARLTTGNAEGSIILFSQAGRVDSTALTANDLIDARSRGSDIALGSADAGQSITLFTDAGGIGATTLTAGDYIDVRARDDIGIATATAGTAIDMTSLLGAIAGTTFTAGTNAAAGDNGGVTLTAGTDVTLGTIDAATDITIGAVGSVTVDTATTTQGITIDSGGDITLANARAVDTSGESDGGDIDLTASGAVTVGTATAGDEINATGATIAATSLTTTGADDGEAGISLAASDGIAVTAFDSGATATVNSTNGPVSIGSGAARGRLSLTSGGTLTGETLTVLPSLGEDGGAGDLAVQSGGTTSIGAATASGAITVASTGDITRFATILAGDGITVTTDGALTAGTVTSTRGTVDLTAANALTAGTLSAGLGVNLTTTGGNIVVDTATAGAGTQAGGADDGRSIHVRSGGDATIGTGTAAIDIGIAAAGSINATSLNAPVTLILLPGTNLTLGSAVSLGQVYIANASVLPAIGDFDRTRLAAATPTPTGGFVTITGSLRGDAILASAGGPLTFGTILANDSADVRSGSTITGDTLFAGRAISLAAAGAVRINTDIAVAPSSSPGGISVSATDIALNALGDLRLATVDATNGNLALTSSGGAITVDRATATNTVLLASGTGVGGTANPARAITANTIRAGSNATVTALGPIAIGSATAGGTLEISSASSIDLSSGSAGFNTNLFGAGAIGVGTVTTARNFTADTGGAITLTNVTAGGLLTASSSGATLNAGTLMAGDDINLSSAGNLSFASATSTSGDVSANTRGDLSFGQANAGGSVLLAATGALGIIDDGSITAGDSISATTGLDLSLRALSAVNNLTLNAGGALAIIDATANAGVLTLTAGRTLTVSGTGTAGTAAALTAGGAITLANVTAGTTLTARSTAGTLTAGTLRAGDDLTLTAAGDLSLADGATTRGGIALTGAAIRVTSASAAGSFAATATDTIDIAAPLLTAGRGITLTAANALTTGGLRATNSIAATSGAAVRIGDVESIGGTVRTTAGTDMTIGNVRAAGSIFLTAAAAITAGDLTAGTGPILPGEGATSGIGGGTGGGTDAAPAGIAAGFDSASIVRCDDCFTTAVGLPFLVNYFGNTYGSTYVNNNGYLTFNTGQPTYTPTGLGTAYRGQPIIAAFFADVDTRNALSRQVTYGEGTYAGRQAFGATYDNVGYYNNRADKLNSFQIVLTNRADTGTGNFDIYYNYTNITWETGDVSGGFNGLGGVSAAVGFNAGTNGLPGTFFELAGSRIPGSFLNTGPAPLITTTNNGTPGQLVFMVRNGQIVPGGATERPTIHVSNTAGATPAAIQLGNLSAEAAEVHGSGAVTVGNVAVGDRGSGIAATSQPYATVLDAATNLTAGNIMSTGLVALGAREGDLLGGSLTTASSAAVLVGGAVQLGAVTTGTGAGDSLFVSAPSVLGTGTGDLANFGFATLLGNAGFNPATLAATTPDRIGGALTIAGPVTTGNFIAAASGVTTLGAIDATNAISVDSGGDLNSTRLTAGGDITANTDQDLVFDTANARGNVTLTAAGALSPIDDGSITAGRSISASTGLDLTVGSLAANENLTLRSGGALTLGSGAARTGTLTLAAARGLTVTGSATAGDDAVLTAGGAIATGAVTGGDTVSISSTGGSVTVTDLLATNGITARALGNLFVRDAVVNAATGNVQLAGGFPFAATTAGAPFLLTGNTTVSGTVSAGSVTIQGGGDVAIGGGGRIRSDGTILIASGDDIVVDSGAVIGLGQIVRPITTAGQSQDRTGGPSNVVTLSAGSLRGGTANLATNGPSGIVMNGTVDGLQLALNSETIDIGATGRVGSALTTATVFTNTGTGRTIVGGAGDTTNYALSNTALGRTRGQAIRVVAPADVTVQTLSLTGSAATDGNLSGTAASFEIGTPGSVSVEGAATIASAGQSDLFAITAGNRITVLTPSGSIALNGAGTSLAGRIRLAAPRIVVATQPAITALDGLTTLDARDERLADNDGTLSDAGFLQANALEFRVASALYIQNSGSTRVSDARRGFTAGSGGVTIVTTGTSPAEIAINGRQAQTDGTFITGKTLIDRLTLSGTGQATMASFDPRSTVNGCLIVGMNCRFDGMAPTQPIQDVINQIINGQDDITGAISSVVQQLNSPLIELIDFTPFRLAGIIDEPVTGAGNDDFYTSFIGDDDFATSGTTSEQVTGTGNDLVNDEQVTGTGKDQATKEEPDGQCDPKRKDVDPDCK